ncbi:MAG TPA: ABC transporter permease [Burkholderiales bacterium]
MSTSKTEPGLSAEYVRYRGGLRRRRLLVLAIQVALVVLVLALWEWLPRAHLVNPLLTSYPSALWPTFVDLLVNGHLLAHTGATMVEALVGFVLSMAIGIGVASALWWSETVYRVLDPFLVVANAMPKIALVPIFYIWLGPRSSIYGIAIAIAVFSTIIMIYAGFRGIDPNKIKLARTFGASRRQVLAKVVLPGSVPTLIAALKMTAGLVLVGVVVGEFQSADAGLGYLIVNGSQMFKMNVVMTSVTLLAVLSCLIYLAVHFIEKALARRYV